jgi:hypothetical protein
MNMSRRWSSFDTETTNAEFLVIPQPDRAALFGAMKAYKLGLPSGYTLKNYGDRLQMIKASNRTAGRCLFFSVQKAGEDELLVVLLAYKKETDEAPKRLVETARHRMRGYSEGKKA